MNPAQERAAVELEQLLRAEGRALAAFRPFGDGVAFVANCGSGFYAGGYHVAGWHLYHHFAARDIAGAIHWLDSGGWQRRSMTRPKPARHSAA